MSDDHPRYDSSSPEPSAQSGLDAMQFSLTGLFVLMTVVALLTAAFFGVGRLVGMSVTEILTMGLGRFLLTLPVILIWAIGFTVAMRRLGRNPLAASLTMIALGGMFVTLLVVNVSQMAAVHMMTSGRIDSGVMSRSMTAIGIGYTVLNTVWWILIPVAIFAKRPPDSAVPQSMPPQKPLDSL